MKCAFLLNVVVGESSAVFKLLSGENETLLVRWNAFLVLNLCLDALNCVCRLDIERDCLACECFNENLHGC